MNDVECDNDDNEKKKEEQKKKKKEENEYECLESELIINGWHRLNISNYKLYNEILKLILNYYHNHNFLFYVGCHNIKINNNNTITKISDNLKGTMYCNQLIYNKTNYLHKWIIKVNKMYDYDEYPMTIGISSQNNNSILSNYDFAKNDNDNHYYYAWKSSGVLCYWPMCYSNSYQNKKDDIPYYGNTNTSNIITIHLDIKSQIILFESNQNCLFGFNNIMPDCNYRLAIRMTHKNDTVKILSYTQESKLLNIDSNSNVKSIYNGLSKDCSQSAKYGYIKKKKYHRTPWWNQAKRINSNINNPNNALYHAARGQYETRPRGMNRNQWNEYQNYYDDDSY